MVRHTEMTTDEFDRHMNANKDRVGKPFLGRIGHAGWGQPGAGWLVRMVNHGVIVLDNESRVRIILRSTTGQAFQDIYLARWYDYAS